LVILTATVVAAAVLAMLYWAHAVLIPLALAVFLTYLLSPLVNALQRRGLGRVWAVAAATLLAAAVIALVGYIVVGELNNLVHELPNYSGTLKAKIAALFEDGESGVLGRLQKMAKELGSTWNSSGADQTSDKPAPVPVVVESGEPAVFRWLPSYLPTLAEFLSRAGLVIVLAIFMLLQREDLRNRCIRVIGRGHITTTTKAIDEASRRISGFLLMQLAINTCYGIIFTIGLMLIGVEHAPLWGFLAGLLRYVPYLGAPFAAVLPLAMSLVQFEGWLEPILVTVLFVVLELLAYNIAEPLLFGHSTGVSPIALLTAAAFWAFCWGPVGLVLSCPLTVCLVVLGKYVPRLEFLEVLLGNESPLEDKAAFYQRLSARDLEEAKRITQNFAKQNSPEEVFDSLLLPALTAARRDRLKGRLDDDDLHFIHEGVQVLIEDWKATFAASSKNSDKSTSQMPRCRIAAIAARDEFDALTIEMMQLLCGPEKWQVQVAGPDALLPDIEKMIEDEDAMIVVVAAVQPGSLARARYLCKQLRKQLPSTRLVVGLFGRSNVSESSLDRLQSAGADCVEPTVLGLRNYLKSWLPVLLHKHASVTK
jgi:predicted PurR-regulated permease PerM